jgi:hypothetical protein
VLNKFPLCVILVALFLQSCAGPSGVAQVNQPVGTAATAAIAGDDSEVIRAQNAHAIKVEVTVNAPVYKLLRDDTQGLPHQKFLLQLSNGTTILVAHDIKYAPRVPLNLGDRPTIHGEYIWNRKGGLIHWTHHSDTPRHEGGWIDLNGNRYE